jgi:hypothetical protein
MAMESRLHELGADQVYVIFQALLQGKDHPLHQEASDMAKEYIKDHQTEMIGRGQEKTPVQHKRAG